MKYGQTLGKRTVWYENGEIRSISEHADGRELNYVEWSETNKLIISRRSK